MTAYQLTFINNSPEDWTAAVYQKPPDLGDYEVLSLAWFAKKAYTGTTVTFTWDINYNFVWAQTGQLIPGVQFTAGETVDANLTSQNSLTLDYDPSSGGAFYFLKPPKAGENNGTLYTPCTNHVPAGMASVGIGMSGFGTYVVQAEPQLQAMFTPHPNYWIVFGQYTQGLVLDITQIAGSSAEVTFPADVYHMNATLDSGNNWTIAPAT